MPKKKTNKAAAKRVKLTAGGKVKYKMAGSGHLMSSKNSQRRRNLRKHKLLSGPESHRMKELLAS